MRKGRCECEQRKRDSKGKRKEVADDAEEERNDEKCGVRGGVNQSLKDGLPMPTVGTCANGRGRVVRIGRFLRAMDSLSSYFMYPRILLKANLCTYFLFRTS